MEAAGYGRIINVLSTSVREPIPNLGELRIPLLTRESTVRGMSFTGAPVAKPLASVKKICSAGHICVFDDDSSYVYNKSTGEYTVMREESGSYVLDAWVPPSTTFGRQP